MAAGVDVRCLRGGIPVRVWYGRGAKVAQVASASVCGLVGAPVR